MRPYSQPDSGLTRELDSLVCKRMTPKRPMAIVILLSMLLGGTTLSPATATEPTETRTIPQAKSMADTIVVQDDVESMVRSVTIDAPNGQVSGEDVFRAIARLQGYADDELRHVLPGGRIDLKNRFVSHGLIAMNAAFAPHIGFCLTQDNDRQTRLKVTVDRVSILKCQREAKSEIRKTLVKNWPMARRQEFGLRMDSGWETCDTKLPLVIVVHGYNSGPIQAAELLDLPRAQELPCGLFHYPNDQPIARSSRLLARELKDLADAAKGRDVVLVAHSMGGVLARETLENPQLDPGNVSRLIMLSPPNHGSQLAKFAIVMDLWEAMAALLKSDEYRSLFAAVEDGLGEASVDLEPGSVFLTRLNDRARNPNVRYSIITGTSAPIMTHDVHTIRSHLTRLAKHSRWTKFMVSKCDRMLADLDEIVDGRGDGVVACKRARLRGVTDFVALRFGHNEPISARRLGDAERVHREVIKRIMVK